MPETITQLVISAVHNSKQILLTKIAASVAEQRGSFVPIEDVNGIHIGESKTAALEAILTTLQQKQSEHGELPLVTILADFNLGYSGSDVSPLSGLIDKIEKLPAEKKYKFVKSTEQLCAIDIMTEIPVRIYTTGGGGQKIEPQAGLMNIDRESAKKAFGFDGKDIINFCSTLRGSPTPRPPNTPSVRSRRLEPSSPLGSPLISHLNSSPNILIALARASSATESMVSSTSSGSSRSISSSSSSGSASPGSPDNEEKILPAMGLLNLKVPERNNALDDMSALLSAIPVTPPSSSSKRTSPKTSPRRPSPIKTSLEEPKEDADKVARVLFR
jgi:hypothetical protein